MSNRVSKQTVINEMSDRARSLAMAFERDMSLKSVEINNKRWVKK